MKRLFIAILTLAMLLSLCACGKDAATTQSPEPEKVEEPATTEPVEEPSMLTIGDTAQGSSCNVTVTSVEFVDKIENGYLNHMWSPAEKDTYRDVTAEEGYSIVKISYHFEYTGKEAGVHPVGFVLNYDDGYTFAGGYDFEDCSTSNGAGGHALPAIDFSKLRMGYEEKYVFGQQARFEINDPLEFQETDAFVYIFVNDEVKTNTDKSYVLEVSVPSTAFDDATVYGLDGSFTSPEVPEIETFVYNLR